MEPLKLSGPEEERRQFLRWVRENTARWSRGWIRLIYKHIPSYGIVPRGELEDHIARHFEYLLAYWEDGSEEPLSAFYLELSKERIRQEIEWSCALAQRIAAEHVEDPGGHVVGPGLEEDALAGVQRGQVVEEDLRSRDFGMLEVDGFDLDQPRAQGLLCGDAQLFGA